MLVAQYQTFFDSNIIGCRDLYRNTENIYKYIYKVSEW